MTTFNLRVGSATDVGQIRKINQDAIVTAGGIYGVADGMGGHQGGEVASAVAVEVLGLGMTEPTPSGFEAAVRAANRAVYEQGQARDDLAGMGTTVVAIAEVDVDGEPHLVIVNVGDSRGYLLRDHDFVQITEDHSLVADLVRAGRITAEEAENHPRRNIVTRVLGLDDHVRVDQFAVQPTPGDRFLMCSDGLTNEVSDADITATLRRIDDPDEAAVELVRMANEAGGRDNISIVIVDVLDDAGRAIRPLAAIATSVEPPPSDDPVPVTPPEVPEEPEIAGQAEAPTPGETDFEVEDEGEVDAVGAVEDHESAALDPDDDALGALGALGGATAMGVAAATTTPGRAPGGATAGGALADIGGLAPADLEAGIEGDDAGEPDDDQSTDQPETDQPDVDLAEVSAAAPEPDEAAEPPDEPDEAAESAEPDNEATEADDVAGSPHEPDEPDEPDASVEPEKPDAAADIDEPGSAAAPEPEQKLTRRERKKRRAEADEPAATSESKAPVDDLAGFGRALDDDQLAGARDTIAVEDDLDDLIPSRRRFSWRVALFLFVVFAIVGVAVGALAVYARGTYFVGFDDNRVAVFQGRPGGVLFFDPTVEAHGNVVKAELLPVSSGAVAGEPEFGTLREAEVFVSNLQLVIADKAPITGEPGSFDDSVTPSTTTVPAEAPDPAGTPVTTVPG